MSREIELCSLILLNIDCEGVIWIIVFNLISFFENLWGCLGSVK